MHKTAVNHLDNAVAEVFDTMLGERCLPVGSPALAPDGFCASVRFTGGLSGVCTISLDRRTAASLAAALLGEDGDVAIDPAIEEARSADTVGELCNMIAGSWKSRLPAELAACSLSPPQVRLNRAPAALCPDPAPPPPPNPAAHWTRVYCFGTAGGTRNFGLELTLHSR